MVSSVCSVVGGADMADMVFRELTEFPNGVKPEYTFFTDFDIAGNFDAAAIEDTYNRVLKEWGDNYKAMTEVSISLNLLCWDYYERGLMEMSRVFSDYYYKSRDYFYDHFDGNDEALRHYFEMTD